jgi:gamma-glutamyltranspeptidase
MTYEDYLGRRGLDKYGKKEWNKLLQEAIKYTEATLQLGPPLPRRRQHQEDRLSAAKEC